MFRTNMRFCSLVLSVMLVLTCMVTAQASELISQDNIVADEVNYKTATVHYGDLVKPATNPASEYYPVETVVYHDGIQSAFVESLARMGDIVEKGDPLMRVSVVYDQVALTQQQLNYTRSMESFEEGKRTRQERIAQLEKQVAAAQDDYTRQCAQIELEKANVQYAQYCYQQERSLSIQLENLEEFKAQIAQDVIYAPASGEVTAWHYMYAGETIYNGTYICTIRDINTKLVGVKDSQLRYGMEVMVETGSNNNRVEFPGKVVATSDFLPEYGKTIALVEYDASQMPQDAIWRNVKVHSETLNVQNVLLINRKAATLTGGKYVVQILSEDGVLQRRNIIPSIYVGNDMWVLQGVEEGDELIID